MAERYAAMRAEVRKPAYAGLSAAEVRAIVVARDIDIERDVSIEIVNRRLIGQGIVGKVRARMAALEQRLRAGALTPEQFEASAYPALANSLEAFARLPSLETSTAAVRSFVTQIADLYVSEGLMTAPQRTGLLALWIGKTSIAERDRFPDPTVQEIETERAREIG